MLGTSPSRIHPLSNLDCLLWSCRIRNPRKSCNTSFAWCSLGIPHIDSLPRWDQSLPNGQSSPESRSGPHILRIFRSPCTSPSCSRALSCPCQSIVVLSLLGCNSIDTLNFGHETGRQIRPQFGLNSVPGHYKLGCLETPNMTWARSDSVPASGLIKLSIELHPCACFSLAQLAFPYGR